VRSIISIIGNETHAQDFVALGSEVEVIDTIGDDLSSKIDRIFLPELILVDNLVDLEMQLSLVYSDKISLVIAAGHRVNIFFSEFTIECAWEDHIGTHQVVHNAPHLAHIGADADEEASVL